jgi:hypothetical protein
MARFRFTLIGLLGAMVVVAVGLVALRSPTPLAAACVHSAALAAIALALVGAFLARPAARPAWIGFVLCAAVYYFAAFGPGVSDTIRPRLVTTLVLQKWEAAASPAGVAPSPAPMPIPPPPARAIMGMGMAAPTPTPAQASSVTSLTVTTTGTTTLRATPTVFSFVGPGMYQELSDFQSIGHSLFCLVAGGLGLIVAWTRLFGKKDAVVEKVLPADPAGTRGSPPADAS